nr:FAD-dependent oxidoreductase [Halobacterium salinarum]
MTASQRVAVLGGGIAGLTAAQELAERGLDVTVYEANDRLGGKARSIPVDGSDGLLGEHGFRFFPAYYTNVVKTMARIPDGTGGSVADHLVSTSETLIASADGDGAVASTESPRHPPRVGVRHPAPDRRRGGPPAGTRAFRLPAGGAVDQL